MTIGLQATFKDERSDGFTAPLHHNLDFMFMSKYTQSDSSWQTRRTFSHHSHSTKRSCQLIVLFSQKNLTLVSGISFCLRRWDVWVGKKKTQKMTNDSMKCTSIFEKMVEMIHSSQWPKQTVCIPVVPVTTEACLFNQSALLTVGATWKSVRTPIKYVLMTVCHQTDTIKVQRQESNQIFMTFQLFTLTFKRFLPFKL